MPALRRWGALLLGAALIFPAGILTMFAASGSADVVLGVGVAAFGIYVTAGAFVPRLLRFGGPKVSLPVVIFTINATLQFAEGRLLSGALWLSLAAVFGLLGHVKRDAGDGASPAVRPER